MDPSTVDLIARIIEGHELVRSIDLIPRGHLRLETAFLYPDGSSIDLFVRQQEPLLPSDTLSDLGQTTSWLMDMQVKPWVSKKRQRFVEDALRLYGVRRVGGALETRVEDDFGDLIDGIVRLGQACVRVADLTYTRRNSVPSGISDELITGTSEHTVRAGIERARAAVSDPIDTTGLDAERLAEIQRIAREGSE